MSDGDFTLEELDTSNIESGIHADKSVEGRLHGGLLGSPSLS